MIFYYFTSNEQMQGCQITPPGFDDFVEISNQIKLATGYAHDFTQLLGKLPIDGGLQKICGLTDQEATAIKTLANVGHDTIHVLNRAFVGLRDVLSCETFNPIYTTFVHQGKSLQLVQTFSKFYQNHQCI